MSPVTAALSTGLSSTAIGVVETATGASHTQEPADTGEVCPKRRLVPAHSQICQRSPPYKLFIGTRRHFRPLYAVIETKCGTLAVMTCRSAEQIPWFYLDWMVNGQACSWCKAVAVPCRAEVSLVQKAFASLLHELGCTGSSRQRRLSVTRDSNTSFDASAAATFGSPCCRFRQTEPTM